MAQEPTSHDSIFHRVPRNLFLMLAWVTMPCFCCGVMTTLDSLPSDWLPGSISLVLNMFEEEAVVVNETDETLFLTAITTNFGPPQVVAQSGIYQRDIPVRPNESWTFIYDGSDTPLAGIVVCHEDDNCRRLLPSGSGRPTAITDFDELDAIDESWMAAVKAVPKTTNSSVFSRIIMYVLAIFPFVGFGLWFYTAPQKDE